MRHKIFKIFYLLPSLLYYALIFFLSSQNYRVKINIDFADKLIHLVEFGLLGFLLSLGFFAWVQSLRKRAVWVFSIGFVLAVLDEVHQIFVPLRTWEVLDLMADILGISIGFYVFTVFYKRIKVIYK